MNCSEMPTENPPRVLGAGSWHEEGAWRGQTTETGEEQGKDVLPRMARGRPVTVEGHSPVVGKMGKLIPTNMR